MLPAPTTPDAPSPAAFGCSPRHSPSIPPSVRRRSVLPGHSWRAERYAPTFLVPVQGHSLSSSVQETRDIPGTSLADVSLLHVVADVSLCFSFKHGLVMN